MVPTIRQSLPGLGTRSTLISPQIGKPLALRFHQFYSGSLSKRSIVQCSFKIGNKNRLGPRSTQNRQYSSFESRDDDDKDNDPAAPNWLCQLNEQWQTAVDRLFYQYYNWREDTTSDLLLFIGFSSLLFLGAASIERHITSIDTESLATAAEGDSVESMWANLYRVLVVVLGQELPEEHASSLATQVFAVAVAFFGIACFALVLALIEQVVLEVLETNVKKGSPVHERGHVVILAFCESSRDVSQVTRLLEELCSAQRSAGGGVVVVVAQHMEKLEMEAVFKEAVPKDNRYGSQFVFRQGSPLDPAALQLAAATDASSVIISGDYSRSSTESDAQVLRCAVLLDEMIAEQYGEDDLSSGPSIVAEVHTADTLSLLQYSCSARVVPVNTRKLNAVRYARLIRQPTLALVSHMLTRHSSVATGYIGRFPQLIGRPFHDVHFLLPQAVVLGIYSTKTKQCLLNPPPDQVLMRGDELVMMKPGSLGGNVTCLDEMLPDGVGMDWNREKYQAWINQQKPAQFFNDESGGSSSGGNGGFPAVMQQNMNGATLSNVAAINFEDPSSQAAVNETAATTANSTASSSQASVVEVAVYNGGHQKRLEVLLCGWPGNAFMSQLLIELDSGVQALPPGSSITVVNDHRADELKARVPFERMKNVSVCHRKCDPRCKVALEKALEKDLDKFDAAVIMQDIRWGAGRDPHTASHRSSQADQLRLDAAVLMVQLNVRQTLEEANVTNINIITEKMSYVGMSRYEDSTRLPAGSSVNSAAFAAKVLASVAIDPRVLLPLTLIGVESESNVQDASAFAGKDEALTILQLQARMTSVRQIFIGYYVEQGGLLKFTINPQGVEARSTPIAWNKGDGKCKLITFALRSTPWKRRGNGSDMGLSVTSEVLATAVSLTPHVVVVAGGK